MTRKEKKRLKKKPPRLKLSNTKLDQLARAMGRIASRIPSDYDDHKHFCGVCRMYYCGEQNYCHECWYVRNFPDACLKESKGVKTCIVCKRGWEK